MNVRSIFMNMWQKHLCVYTRRRNLTWTRWFLKLFILFRSPSLLWQKFYECNIINWPVHGLNVDKTMANCYFKTFTQTIWKSVLLVIFAKVLPSYYKPNMAMMIRVYHVWVEARKIQQLNKVSKEKWTSKF